VCQNIVPPYEKSYHLPPKNKQLSANYQRILICVNKTLISRHPWKAYPNVSLWDQMPPIVPDCMPSKYIAPQFQVVSSRHKAHCFEQVNATFDSPKAMHHNPISMINQGNSSRCCQHRDWDNIIIRSLT
jgi:hypothetical protein